MTNPNQPFPPSSNVRRHVQRLTESTTTCLVDHDRHQQTRTWRGIELGCIVCRARWTAFLVVKYLCHRNVFSLIFWTRSQKVFHCFVQKVCPPECWSLVAICQRDEQLMSSCIMQPSIPMVALIIWCKKRLAFSVMPFQTNLNTHDRELLWQSNFG